MDKKTTKPVATEPKTPKPKAPKEGPLFEVAYGGYFEYEGVTYQKTGQKDGGTIEIGTAEDERVELPRATEVTIL